MGGAYEQEIEDGIGRDPTATPGLGDYCTVTDSAGVSFSLDLLRSVAADASNNIYFIGNYASFKDRNKVAGDACGVAYLQVCAAIPRMPPPSGRLAHVHGQSARAGEPRPRRPPCSSPMRLRLFQYASASFARRSKPSTSVVVTGGGFLQIHTPGLTSRRCAALVHVCHLVGLPRAA